MRRTVRPSAPFWLVPPRTWTGAWDDFQRYGDDTVDQVVDHCHGGHSAAQKISHFLVIDHGPPLEAILPTEYWGGPAGRIAAQSHDRSRVARVSTGATCQASCNAFTRRACTA